MTDISSNSEIGWLVLFASSLFFLFHVHKSNFNKNFLHDMSSKFGQFCTITATVSGSNA